jgi:hypothetical protein
MIWSTINYTDGINTRTVIVTAKISERQTLHQCHQFSIPALQKHNSQVTSPTLTVAKKKKKFTRFATPSTTLLTRATGEHQCLMPKRTGMFLNSIEKQYGERCAKYCYNKYTFVSAFITNSHVTFH